MATSQTHVAPLSLEETTVSASMPSTWVCFGGWGGVGEVCAEEEKAKERRRRKEVRKKKGTPLVQRTRRMAPPNPFWVQRYLRDHNIDALLADAVNQVCSLRDEGREPGSQRDRTRCKLPSCGLPQAPGEGERAVRQCCGATAGMSCPLLYSHALTTGCNPCLAPVSAGCRTALHGPCGFACKLLHSVVEPQWPGHKDISAADAAERSETGGRSQGGGVFQRRNTRRMRHHGRASACATGAAS